MLLLLGFYRCCIFFYLFFFLSNIFSFLTGLSSLLGPLGFWHLALPVGVCSLECNNNNNAIYRYLNHTSRPHHRRLNLGVKHFLALRARKVLLDSLLDHLRHSDPLPLPDSNLAGRMVLAFRRSLPEPLISEGVFGSRSLVPLWRSAAA